MKLYTEQDCDQVGYNFSLKNKIVVLSKSVLPGDHPGQLFFCAKSNDTNSNLNGCLVFLVSLSTGEHYQFLRNDVLGTLKPERLPEDAKLQLSQIRPSGATDLNTHEPQYSGYSFLPDGRYTTGVWLYSSQEMMDYVEMQKPYQHRILICDRDDFSVLEIINGEVVFPMQTDIEAYQQKQKGGIKIY